MRRFLLVVGSVFPILASPTHLVAQPTTYKQLFTERIGQKATINGKRQGTITGAADQFVTVKVRNDFDYVNYSAIERVTDVGTLVLINTCLDPRTELERDKATTAVDTSRTRPRQDSHRPKD